MPGVASAAATCAAAEPSGRSMSMLFNPVAAAEATPGIADATVLDRYLPLLTDQPIGTGLTLYDITTHETKLIAVNADNVRSAGSVLWWSTTSEDGVEWHAIDLTTLA